MPTDPTRRRGARRHVRAEDRRARSAHRVRDLGDSQALFSRVFEEGPVGKAVFGPDMTVRRVNRALCSMLGYSAEDCWSSTPGPHPRRRRRGRRGPGGAGDDRRDRRLPAREADDRQGRVRLDVVLSASMVRGADGETQYGVGVVEDVTASHRARRALEEQDGPALALGAAHASIWDVDLVSGVVQVSDNLESDLGVALPRTVAQALALLHPDDRDVVHRLATSREVNETVRVLDGRGRVRWLQAEPTVHG